MLAGLTSTIICFPLETVRTRLAVAPQGQFHGMIDCARQIVSREGCGALFKVRGRLGFTGFRRVAGQNIACASQTTRYWPRAVSQ